MNDLNKETLFLLKRCREHLVKQWGEDDGFISRLDVTIVQMENPNETH